MRQFSFIFSGSQKVSGGDRLRLNFPHERFVFMFSHQNTFIGWDCVIQLTWRSLNALPSPYAIRRKCYPMPDRQFIVLNFHAHTIGFEQIRQFRLIYQLDALTSFFEMFNSNLCMIIGMQYKNVQRFSHFFSWNRKKSFHLMQLRFNGFTIKNSWNWTTVFYHLRFFFEKFVEFYHKSSE